MCLIGAPKKFKASLEPLPQGVSFVEKLDPKVTMVHVFEVDKRALEKTLLACREGLADTVVVWASWPKRSARLPSEVDEHVIRELCLPMGFVDIKVCAVDATWSGLKLVVRKELRRS